MRTTSLLLRAMQLFCISAGVSVWAAPTTTPPAEGASEVAPAISSRNSEQAKSAIVEPRAMADVPTTSNTVKMLLELQATPEPGASASESGRPATRAGSARPNASATPGNPFGNGENPFGAQPEFAPPASSSGAQRKGADWQPLPADASFIRDGSGPIGVTGASDDARQPHKFTSQRHGGSPGRDFAEERWWMPSNLIRWVRENRQAVLIGAAVALGLAWASSSWASRRRL